MFGVVGYIVLLRPTWTIAIFRVAAMATVEPVRSLYKLAWADPDPSLDTAEPGSESDKSTDRSLLVWMNLPYAAVDTTLKSDPVFSLRSQWCGYNIV